MKVSEIDSSFYQRGFAIFKRCDGVEYIGTTVTDFLQNCDLMEFIKSQKQAKKYADKEIILSGQIGMTSTVFCLIE